MKNLATITFLIIVFTFSINQCTKVVDKIDKSENRTLAKKPNLDINRLDFFPLEYDRYLKDNFAGRKYFIDGYNWLNNIILHKRSPNGKHLYGKDNYIFEMKKNLPLYTGKRTVSEEQLNRILTEFKERQKYFDSIGVKMYIQIIPSKYTVYSNKIPFFLTKGKNHMGDRFVKEFENKTTIPIINGAKVLVPERDKYNFYRKYDTHWSNLGAFFVVAELIKRIKEDFPNITIMDTSLFTITPYELKGGNMKRTAKDKEDMDFGFDIAAKNKTAKRAKGYVHKVMEEFRYGQGAYCIRYKSNNTKSPKALIIRDSYCNYTTDFLPEMFSETLYIWDDWKYTFNKEIVDIEKPDLIVYSIFEGYIDRLLMNPSFVKKDKADDDVQ